MSVPLQVRDLVVTFPAGRGRLPAVRGVSLDVGEGEIVGVVGESGSGKSTTALALLDLVPRPGRIESGSIVFAGRDVRAMSSAERRRLRGGDVGMVFQEPATALNPVLPVGWQIEEAMRVHRPGPRRERRARAVELLASLGIAEPATRLADYPHQLSGGMRQRAMIAMALANDPRLLIADEPTTALDATIQAQILDLLAALNRERGIAVLLVSHDLGAVARVCDRVLVLYAGQVVETAAACDLFDRPRHPYTRGLLASRLRLDGDRPARLPAIPGRPPDLARPPEGCAFHGRCRLAVERCAVEAPALAGGGHLVACWNPGTGPLVAGGILAGDQVRIAVRTRVPLLEVRDVVKRFPLPSRPLGPARSVTALDGVSLTVARGETLGLVGESGCGKTTLARAVVMAERPTSGSIHVDGEEVTRGGADLRTLRQTVQLVFQDPASALNPRMTVRQMLAEPLHVHRLARGAAAAARVDELLELVGLRPEHGARRPHELSGGQRQRVGIARALVVQPRLLVCDEPVSTLDVAIQAQVANLLGDLRDRLGVAYLLIAHDLRLVRHLADRIAVMYVGQIVESGPAEELCRQPLHPYTRGLVSAASTATRPVLRGEVPSPLRPPSGCRFHTRCPVARARCRDEAPRLVAREPDRLVACHFPGDAQ